MTFRLSECVINSVNIIVIVTHNAASAGIQNKFKQQKKKSDQYSLYFLINILFLFYKES